MMHRISFIGMAAAKQAALIACFAVIALVLASPAQAGEPAVSENARTGLTLYRIHLGGGVGQNRVDPAAMRRFIDTVVTRQFPTGVTIYNAQGQWIDEPDRAVIRETSTVVEIHSPDSQELRDAVAEVARRYVRNFSQANVSVFVQIIPNTEGTVYYGD
ncbi:MAG: DUF3574 domain-containing protein [Planctomycetes bacterium]|nr:DUF3574 domain-containing protein [Planctomycetota bacterium]